MQKNVRQSEACFADLPQHCTDELNQVYNVVESRLKEVSEYVDKWLQFQSLWDLQSEQVYDILGDDLSQWLQLLQEIRKSRATFDTSEVGRSFGNIRIDYEQVQTKVNAKYDQWQHEILLKFGAKLGGRMREVHSEIAAARRDLEGQTLEASSTAHAVSFITIVQQCKRKTRVWEPEVDMFRQGQTTLSRQRYQFPSDWLHVENVDGEWAALNELLTRKSKIVHDQTEVCVQRSPPKTELSATRSLRSLLNGMMRSLFLELFHPKRHLEHSEALSSRALNPSSQSLRWSPRPKKPGLPASAESSLPANSRRGPGLQVCVGCTVDNLEELNDLRDGLWTSVQPGSSANLLMV